MIEGEPWISTTIDATQAPAVTRNLPMRPDGNEMDENGYIYSGSYYNGALHVSLHRKMNFVLSHETQLHMKLEVEKRNCKSKIKIRDSS